MQAEVPHGEQQWGKSQNEGVVSVSFLQLNKAHLSKKKNQNPKTPPKQKTTKQKTPQLYGHQDTTFSSESVVGEAKGDP